MRRFSYSGKDLSEVNIWQIIGVILFALTSPLYIMTLIALFFVPLSPHPESIWDDLRVMIPCWSIFLFIFSFGLGSHFINYYPTIWTDENGISLSFLFLFRIKIPWSEVIDIKEYKYFQKAYLVQARKITPLHFFYSLHYAHSLRPGFLFKKSIDHGEELVREIQYRIIINKSTER
jgi:hypothetical protein